MELSKVYDIWFQRYRDTKIRECGKNSFPLFFLQIDALYPALLVLEETGGKTGSLTAAGEAALTGAKKTATMVARAGRASYVSRDKVQISYKLKYKVSPKTKLI